jgi:hypothetical protein
MIPKHFPTRVSASRIDDNSDFPFLKPKNVDNVRRIAPQKYTVSHNRMDIGKINH